MFELKLASFDENSIKSRFLRERGICCWTHSILKSVFKIHLKFFFKLKKKFNISNTVGSFLSLFNSSISKERLKRGITFSFCLKLRLTRLYRFNSGSPVKF